MNELFLELLKKKKSLDICDIFQDVCDDHCAICPLNTEARKERMILEFESDLRKARGI